GDGQARLLQDRHLRRSHHLRRRRPLRAQRRLDPRRLGREPRRLAEVRRALDLVGPIYSPAYAALGSEYRLRVDDTASFFFRAGVNTRTPDAGRFAGLKVGLGAAFRSVSIDYAFAPGADVGDSHLFALTWRFGTPDSVKGPRER